MNNLFKRDFTLVVIGQVISLFGSAERNRFVVAFRSGDGLLVYPDDHFFAAWRGDRRQKKQA